MRNVLFLCGRNLRRSPTAENLFAGAPGVAVASAGLNPDAEHPLTSELVEWADVILVMEEGHRRRLTRGFSRWLKDKRVVSLDIPDDYEFMDPELVKLLKERVPRHLPGGGSEGEPCI